MSQPGESPSGEDFSPEANLEPDERDPEASPEDVVEQATPLDPTDDEPLAVHRGLEVDEWDAMEQARVVGVDDDGYR